ncbi:MAG: DUF362 domain-containing protein [Candidatus Undinarchaeales archaeon]|nr:DUF362 domain-containing protein [Candidatus Undinarchaeales archaeon]MDP7494068.1 DUF362 domain-containing protein [Candidatus Undinarchaeales archaeon]
MRSTVYFSPVTGKDHAAVSSAARRLLETLLEQEDVTLENKVPLKVHFGEKGNVTYIKPQMYDGIIDLLEEKGTECCFMETNVLYTGERTTRERHTKLAREHGFTRLPVVIADGERGEDYTEVEINKKHFRTCKIAKAYGDYGQLFILAHFKGHMMAGYGGVIKQMAMGCASRGGKLAQHLNSKPFIIPFWCNQCNSCEEKCPAGAITIGRWSSIDRSKCIGCAACTAVCQTKAVQINLLSMIASLLGNSFTERVAEYAYAAQKGKKNIYMNFAIDITSQCDCVGSKMDPIIGDIGVFASTDPVAIDQACCDKLKEAGKKFTHKRLLEYAQKLGLGSRDYELVEVRGDTA